MYGIVVDTLQFSLIYQTFSDGKFVFVSVTKSEITVKFK